MRKICSRCLLAVLKPRMCRLSRAIGPTAVFAANRSGVKGERVC